MISSVFAVTVYEGMKFRTLDIVGINTLKEWDYLIKLLLEYYDKVDFRPVSPFAKRLYKQKYVGTDEFMMVGARKNVMSIPTFD